MIKVLIPTESEFKNYETEIKKLYEENQEKICDTNSFEFVRDNTLFYTFINTEGLIGVIYYFLDDGKFFLNAFSHRHKHALNLRCLQQSLEWFNTDIYAEAQNRASAFCLLRCGFRRVEAKLFVYERK